MQLSAGEAGVVNDFGVVELERFDFKRRRLGIGAEGSVLGLAETAAAGCEGNSVCPTSWNDPGSVETAEMVGESRMILSITTGLPETMG